MAEKEATERRVYVLPVELVERVRRYQRNNLISSEVEAVRRLLDTALHLKDDAQSILDKFHDRFNNDKDLRVLSRDILAIHPLVEQIHHRNNCVEFTLKDGQRARFLSNGDGQIWDIAKSGWVADDHIPF